MKITAAMWTELEATLSTEKAGLAGRSTEFFKASTLTALRRRGLVEFHNYKGWRLTEAGRKVLGA